MKKMSITRLHDGLSGDNRLCVYINFWDGIPGGLDGLLNLRSLLIQATAGGCRQVCQGILAAAAENFDTLCCITDVQSVLQEIEFAELASEPRERSHRSPSSPGSVQKCPS